MSRIPVRELPLDLEAINEELVYFVEFAH